MPGTAESATSPQKLKKRYRKYTDEILAEIASCYDSRGALKKADESAYAAARRRGQEFLNRICAHMEPKLRSHTDESLAKIALQHDSKSEFAAKDAGAYQSARARGPEFLDAICAHMHKRRRTHTDESLAAAAMLHMTRKSFERADYGAYQAARKRGPEFMDRICAHMEPVHRTHTDESLAEIASHYDSRMEFAEEDGGAYKSAQKRGPEFLNKICEHMRQPPRSLTDESLAEIAGLYDSRKAFERADNSAYNAALSRGPEFMNRICEHMISKVSQSTHAYTHILAATACANYIVKVGKGQGTRVRRTDVLRSLKTHLPEFFSGEPVIFDLGEGETSEMLQVPCKNPGTVETILKTIGEPIEFTVDGNRMTPDGNTEMRLMSLEEIIKCAEILMENATPEPAQ
ncbi:hypothetical protein [Roseibium alexandrii]|nr:hypothetical protein [Roseibium alexandrii]